jgi:hypothetical protein
MAIHYVGAGHPGAISLKRRRVPVSLRRHRQIHKVAGSDPMVKINMQSTVKFIKSISCQFGVLNRIITNNESQFTSGTFQEYCKDLGIQICYASVAHLESNGQVKSTNAEILKGLKTHNYDGLEKQGKKWIDELPCTLWGKRTSPSRATGETSFFLVYGAEAILSLEVTMGSLRVQTYDEVA